MAAPQKLPGDLPSGLPVKIEGMYIFMIPFLFIARFVMKEEWERGKSLCSSVQVPTFCSRLPSFL